MNYKRIKLEYDLVGPEALVYYLLMKLGLKNSQDYYKLKTKKLCYLSDSEFKNKLILWYKYYDQNENIEEPKTFNGKIQWLKIYDSTPLKTQLADKYLVREWVKEKIGEEYLINLLGVYDDFDAICFSDLPDKFVIKANHGSGMNIVIKDKKLINITELKKTCDEWLSTIYGVDGFERHYYGIKRKLIIESYIEEMDGDLLDYKIHCFNGRPKLIQIIGDRDLEKHTAKEAFFDINWNRNSLMYNSYEQYTDTKKKPENLDEMLSIAKELSKGFRYVRVDLYNINGKIKFGELTFTPLSGLGSWEKESDNMLVGSWINL